MSTEPLGLEFEPRILHSIVKQGGKKKLDALLTMFRREAPIRLAEIEATKDAVDAKATARVLKSSCANLGLLGLEDLCDQIISGRNHAQVLPEMKSSLNKAFLYLSQARNSI
jgi:hypothetical protein